MNSLGFIWEGDSRLALFQAALSRPEESLFEIPAKGGATRPVRRKSTRGPREHAAVQSVVISELRSALAHPTTRIFEGVR
jgi:hypothetical protein